MDSTFWIVTLLPFFTLVHLGFAIGSTNYFISPPPANASSPTDGGSFTDNIVWTSRTKVNVTYSTNYTSYTVDLYQHLEKAPFHQYIQTVSNHNEDKTVKPESGVQLEVFWTVDPYNATFADGPVFFLWAQSSTESEAFFFMSHYFNITWSDDTAATEVSAVLSSPSLTSTTSSTAFTSSSSVATQNSQGTPNSRSPTTNTVVKIALGVGLGVGVPIVLLLLAWFILHIRRLRSLGSFSDASSPTSENPFSTSWAYQNELAGEVHEIPDNNIQEVPAEQNKAKVYEIPDHAVLEAPNDVTGAELRDAKSPVELLASKEFRRFSWQ